MDTYQTDITKAAGLRYRVQLRCVSGAWQQRHIWYPGTPFITELTAEDWIRGAPPGAHYRPVSDLDAALRPADTAGAAGS